MEHFLFFYFFFKWLLGELSLKKIKAGKQSDFVTWNGTIIRRDC